MCTHSMLYGLIKDLQNQVPAYISNNVFVTICRCSLNKLTNQCDQNGIFRKVLMTKCLSKVAQNFSNCWSILKTATFKSKLCDYNYGSFKKQLGYFLCQQLVTLLLAHL